VVELICTADPTIAPQARLKPEEYLFVLLEAAHGGNGERGVALMAAGKAAFRPLGTRMEYFNKALAGCAQSVENLPPTHADTASAWALDAVNSLFEEEVLARIKNAQDWLGALKRIHQDLTTEAAAHHKECKELIEQAEQFREVSRAELERWETFVGLLQERRFKTLRELHDHMLEVRDLVAGACSAAPRGVDSEHERQIGRLLEECKSTFQNIQEDIKTLDERISAVSDL
jgi:hypothetical protein